MRGFSWNRMFCPAGCKPTKSREIKEKKKKVSKRQQLKEQSISFFLNGETKCLQESTAIEKLSEPSTN